MVTSMYFIGVNQGIYVTSVLNWVGVSASAMLTGFA